VVLYIYIFIASMIWRFTYICYKSKEQQWKESKNETRKKNNKQKYIYTTHVLQLTLYQQLYKLIIGKVYLDVKVLYIRRPIWS